MWRRFVCLICAAVVLVGSLLSLRVCADTPRLPAPITALARARFNPKSNPLVSAMFLVLAGVGVSMLFDKKN